ncbi:pro-sigmaK processing inhibitor BofA family protein [Peptoniphilus equinus]|uniref:Pro-sigmaK processing inhibitor BofA family protein n=1 Tax=Peptoniphilus equinus TaxID=3016343 RepID=A0ABY7QSS1_9FIRM|nr:pro-sigmaK processing inhibitor BofA family protein [Peptoniphilus equinus]WBW49851.1 pro-sigmaK processing inhibitor BofA family protein [Peptoniphilus equinus]
MELFFIGAAIAVVASLVLGSMVLMFKVLMNIIGGAVLLFVVNLVLEPMGLGIAIGPLTALLTGIFGIPYVVVLTLIKLFL